VRPETAARLADLHSELARVYQHLARETSAPEPERALTLPEAAAKLGATKSWLSRKANYSRIGGYLDMDRRVKFPLSAILRFITSQGTSTNVGSLTGKRIRRTLA
jgi:predicted DNA-binding transcriptional regulator AlpA